MKVNPYYNSIVILRVSLYENICTMTDKIIHLWYVISLEVKSTITSCHQPSSERGAIRNEHRRLQMYHHTEALTQTRPAVLRNLHSRSGGRTHTVLRDRRRLRRTEEPASSPLFFATINIRMNEQMITILCFDYHA